MTLQLDAAIMGIYNTGLWLRSTREGQSVFNSNTTRCLNTSAATINMTWATELPQRRNKSKTSHIFISQHSRLKGLLD